MTHKKKQPAPEAPTAAPLRARSSRITKPRATNTNDDGVRRSSRLIEKPPMEPVRRYKNGLLNLERTPSYLVHVVKRNATDSPLLRIPPEIRNKIWALAMGGQYVKTPGFATYIERGGYKTHCGYTTKGGAMLYPPFRELKWPRVRHIEDPFPRHQEMKVPSAFHLPEVCRQVYSETAILGYSSNTLLLPRQHSFPRNWATGLLPAYRRAITRVEPEPRYLCELVGGHKGLRPIKTLGLPGLITIVVSRMALSYVSSYYRDYESDEDEEDETDEEWQQWIKEMIKKSHGDDIEVVFEQGDNVSG